MTSMQRAKKSFCGQQAETLFGEKLSPDSTKKALIAMVKNMDALIVDRDGQCAIAVAMKERASSFLNAVFSIFLNLLFTFLMIVLFRSR